MVRRAGDEARLAIEELRDLARGIHPAILTNRGLGSALEDLGSRSGLPVEIVAVPDRRLPDQVEAAAYFIVSESLTNAAKHAGASAAWVSATAVNGTLRVEVRDDGSGGGGGGLRLGTHRAGGPRGGPGRDARDPQPQRGGHGAPGRDPASS